MESLDNLFILNPISAEVHDLHERSKLTLRPLIEAFVQKFGSGADPRNSEEIRDAAFGAGLGYVPTHLQAEVSRCYAAFGAAPISVSGYLERVRRQLQERIDRGEVVPERRPRRKLRVRFDERTP